MAGNKGDLKEVSAQVGGTQERVKWKGRIAVPHTFAEQGGNVSKQRGIQIGHAVLKDKCYEGKIKQVRVLFCC